ncbi:hypothetical protein SAMN05421668_13355 [Halolactibacillus miurensis]|uniref:Uncharacterized protein n=1 Tax=Halolactibacillus miurensis TaxID=306541 RepID=A0A1I6UUW7_9BACI|nr:hypothetical protein SAMN05421668_13355 [Halolactibacillus miurensis]
MVLVRNFNHEYATLITYEVHQELLLKLSLNILVEVHQSMKSPLQSSKQLFH